MWWNRSKTPSKSEDGRIRDLEIAVAEMSADFEKVFNLIAKINGRLRQRERRADESERGRDSESGDGGDQPMPDFVAPIQTGARGEEQSSGLTLPAFSKEQLRQLARQRGLLRT